MRTVNALCLVLVFCAACSAKQAPQPNPPANNSAPEAESTETLVTDIQLPTHGEGDFDPNNPELVVTLDANGQVAVNGGPVPLGDLELSFRVAFEQNNDTRVVIYADKATPHGRVVEVITLAKKNGLTRIAIAVRK